MFFAYKSSAASLTPVNGEGTLELGCHDARARRAMAYPRRKLLFP